MPQFVLDLTDPAATDPAVAGAKAANLARARAAGFATVPGVVITTAAVDTGVDTAEVRRAVLSAVRRLGDVDLVVRSSSTIEDIGTSSMAGRFTSVLDVRGADQILSAINTVIDSADRVRDTDGRRRPIAVLIQRQIPAVVGGVMFGLDPVSGERRHLVIEAVAGGPDRLVGGGVLADHYVITRHGRFVRATHTGGAPVLTRHHRHHLARIARRAARRFGGPQDIEWLIDSRGAIWFLQSRPVTAAPDDAAGRTGRHRGRRSVLLGPGPLAETFPAPLRPLEINLWITPLRTGIARALRTVGAATPAMLDRSPIVTVIGGRPAVDLDLIGVVDGRTTIRRRLAPARMLRRLATAWRVGRLRVAFSSLADGVIRTIDRDLADIDHPSALDTVTLIGVLTAAVDELATAHTYEVLAGMLHAGDVDDGGVTAAGRALASLAAGRAAGWDDATIIARAPEVLALVPPRLIHPAPLPVASGEALPADGEMSAREELRLRVRWLQELTRRLADELGHRLAASGAVASPESVAHLRLDELVALCRGGPPPVDLDDRVATPVGAPLPSAFRLGVDDVIHPAAGRRRTRAASAAGEPAGGGRAAGIVVHDTTSALAAARDGEQVVLVTDHLTPDLAPTLVHLAGLVAETGSALSHLAILAREAGVATVAGVPDSRARYPVGTHVLVDGRTGEIVVTEPATVGR